jgi:hypothetical protein
VQPPEPFKLNVQSQSKKGVITITLQLSIEDARKIADTLLLHSAVAHTPPPKAKPPRKPHARP